MRRASPPFSHSASLKNLLDSGISLNDALKELRRSGASPINCIKAIREVQNVPLGEAKGIFECSAAWSTAESEAKDKLIDQLLQALEKDGWEMKHS